METSSMGKLYIHFDFEVKFEFKPPFTIVMEKEGVKWKYVLSNRHDVQVWREILKARINQRGFH